MPLFFVRECGRKPNGTLLVQPFPTQPSRIETFVGSLWTVRACGMGRKTLFHKATILVVGLAAPQVQRVQIQAHEVQLEVAADVQQETPSEVPQAQNVETISQCHAPISEPTQSQPDQQPIPGVQSQVEVATVVQQEILQSRLGR